MPELLIELFSEEIPARMQARAAEDLGTALLARLAPLMTERPRTFHGPRRLTAVGAMALRAESAGREDRGPRVGAPDAAIEGFLRKHGAARDALRQDKGFWVLDRPGATVAAAELLATAVPALLRGFAWPKSMRWDDGGFTWVRPLRRILCVLDGAAVPLVLGDGLPPVAVGDLTEGHRVMAPEAFAVRGFAEYERALHERHVVLDARVREAAIRDGVARLAAAQGVAVVPDAALLAEVAGLVEWPVPLLGRIDDAFMDLPPEVLRTTMRANQKYFSMRRADGGAAPFFGVVANIAAADGGAAIVAGNERVLRARLADARFFWDQDRRQRLEAFLPKLDGVTFHAKLGTQGERVRRLMRLAEAIAPMVGADPAQARRAAELAKADLATGMVGEFPELQGVMGRAYALHGGEPAAVAEAIEAHYRPLGPTDAVPREPVSVAVALADKLDQLAGFFAVGERPTGSGDLYALRRAALGVIRIVLENRLRLRLSALFPDMTVTLYAQLKHSYVEYNVEAQNQALRDVTPVGAIYQPDRFSDEGMDIFRRSFSAQWEEKERPKLPDGHAVATDILDFLADRLRVALRAEGARHDIVAAVFGATPDDDLVRLLARADALRALLDSPEGADLLAAYRRAENILRIEDRRDGPHAGPPDPALFRLPQEHALAEALATTTAIVHADLAAERFAPAMAALAALRPPLDAFFTEVVVNDPDQQIRRNRLGLLAGLRAAMDQVADLSRLEG